LLTIATIATACHTAHLDVSVGQGLLIGPLASGDMSVEGPLSPSLHACDELAMLALLDGHGFDLGEDGESWEQVGTTAEGKQVFHLYGRESIMSDPTSVELAQSFTELAAAAGLLPQQRSA
jgi:hypothetical protein